MTVIVRVMRETCVRCFVVLLAASCIFLAGCTSVPGIETGTLQFSSSPAGAEIYLDGEYRGTTPATLAGVAPGSHTLEYRYPGYASWTDTVNVPAGTSQFYAALTPEPATGGEDKNGGSTVTEDRPEITLKVSKDPMIIGESMVFSGTATNTVTVFLTLYGPGSYSKGVGLTRSRPSTLGLWSYTWMPGTKIQSGTYTIKASDDWNITSALVNFNVIGGGVVTVVPSRYAASKGSTITFSGRCTSGTDNVRLVLLGPGRFSGGIELGMVPVLENDTWSFRYLLEPTMPTGTYTITVYDVPKTTSGSSQFTVGYTS